jgi:hypothetical protein
MFAGKGREPNQAFGPNPSVSITPTMALRLLARAGFQATQISPWRLGVRIAKYAIFNFQFSIRLQPGCRRF